MKNKNKILLGVACVSFTFLFSCNKSDLSVPVKDSSSPTASGEKLDNEGYVYTMTNNVEQNAILIYAQHQDGSLTLDGSVQSGGAGTGTELGTQGALTLNKEHSMLFTVNAGDNTISSFAVDAEGGLTLVSTVSSQGAGPVSITNYGQYVYVVHVGSNDIHGFTVSNNGVLTAMPGSERSLSAFGADPGEIKFKANGKGLIVTEKATNKITAYSIDAQGLPGQPVTHPSKGQTPFGFDFAAGSILVVANASADMPGKASATSYLFGNTGQSSYTGPVHNNQTSSCWLVVARKTTKYAYVTNSGSNTISSYSVDNDGHLNILQEVAVTTGAAPIDLVLSGNEKYVYNINHDAKTIGEYSVNMNGSLTLIGHVEDIPEFAAGLAAYK